MRRFLVFVLISGLASAANAATVDLVVTVGGSPYAGQDLDVGTVVKVEVVQSATDTANVGGKLTVDFVGANPTITDTTPQQVYDSGQGTMYGWNWSLNNGVAVSGTGPAYTAQKNATANATVGTPGIGALMDPMNNTLYSSTFEFTFQATETTTLDWGTATDWHTTGGSITLADAVTVNVVPEPTTVALLVLGGLFLRRRK